MPEHEVNWADRLGGFQEALEYLDNSLQAIGRTLDGILKHLHDWTVVDDPSRPRTCKQCGKKRTDTSWGSAIH